MTVDKSQSLPADLHAMLSRGPDASASDKETPSPTETLFLSMRDGIRLATDVYLPKALPAPVVVLRTPYLRAHHAQAFGDFLAAGFAIVAQDVRGTGDSEPDHWDYYIHEREDSYDCADWISRQPWCDGFIGGCGSSYNAQMQWCMAMHPAMSAIAPEVAGLGIAFRCARKYMFFSAYARTVGKGQGKVAIPFYEMERQILPETLAGGLYNDPLEPVIPKSLTTAYPFLAVMNPGVARRWLWDNYAALTPAARATFIKRALEKHEVSILEIEALPRIFGQNVAHDAHTLPVKDPVETVRALCAPVLMISGWYDWSLNDTLATWDLISMSAPPGIAARSRLIIAPSAHNMSGYHEGRAGHPELERTYRLSDITDLLIAWNQAVRNDALSNWPTVVYYLMGANEWRIASTWPPAETESRALYLREGGALALDPDNADTEPDAFTYDPLDPAPTLGGSIVSGVYPPGSVDVSSAQSRSDVLVYTSPVIETCIDVVGPLSMTLFASSSAIDTDFVVRLTDVFPDGRAIQLQSSLMRARYRSGSGEPELLEPHGIYEFEIDLWATANRFEAGHRIRVDITSADFPRFERNSNQGGVEGPPVRAEQRIYRDRAHPSRLEIQCMPQRGSAIWREP